MSELFKSFEIVISKYAGVCTKYFKKHYNSCVFFKVHPISLEIVLNYVPAIKFTLLGEKKGSGVALHICKDN